ncbi:unnamed protein product [Adineta steineri]|uniref:Uncharacterized protein n=1 Tax=Adineta steineri TaxID=433720 RepID=A0A814GAC6_9BILA|nr:unnamed protein product [Adineta steineri]CAF3631247.1 unnamed protein product [Adineta steineri]
MTLQHGLQQHTVLRTQQHGPQQQSQQGSQQEQQHGSQQEQQQGSQHELQHEPQPQPQPQPQPHPQPQPQPQPGILIISSVTGTSLEKISFGITAILFFNFSPLIILVIFIILSILNIRHEYSSINSASTYEHEMQTITMLVLIKLSAAFVELLQDFLLVAICNDKFFLIL